MKKATVIYSLVLTTLIGAVTLLLFFLYSDNGERNSSGKDPTESVISSFPLLASVPSDAVALMTFDHFDDALSILSDSTRVFGELVTDAKNGRFKKFVFSLDSLMQEGRLGVFRRKEAVLSVHYGRDLLPLLIVDVGNASSSSDVSIVEEFAKKDRLYLSLFDCENYPGQFRKIKKKKLLMVSPSETIVLSSQRHLNTGVSILDASGFAEIASKVSSGDVFFLNNFSVGKFLRPILNYKYFFMANKAREFAEWTYLRLEDYSDSYCGMSGEVDSQGDTKYYSSMFCSGNGGELKMFEVLPLSTVYAASFPMRDPQVLSSKHKEYLDAIGRLENNIFMSRSLEEDKGINPVEWATRIQIKEAGIAVYVKDGGLENIAFLRVGKPQILAQLLGNSKAHLSDDSESSLMEYSFRGYLQCLFGDIFSKVPEDYVLFNDKWVLIGRKSSISKIKSSKNEELTVAGILSAAKLSDRINIKNCPMAIYLSPSSSPLFLKRVFRDRINRVADKAAAGNRFTSMILSLSDKNENIRISLDADRVTFAPDVHIANVDTTVNIPKGPFKVKNCKTGRINYFGQNKNMWLTLSDSNGKGIWGVKFSEPICGRAGMVDYFTNGKIQFIFAAGTKIYVLDRLGRKVSGFPIDLKKEILLGPDVYDFSGSKKYNILVLHKDNTIEMYNLRGNRPSKWKTIAPKEAIKNLPEELVIAEKRYWVVRTSARTLIYDFYGGNPLINFEGKKIIRPDSPIQVDGRSVVVTCYDGRERNLKLN